VCAIVKAEDRGFFRHSGFEWGQLCKALWGRVTGGSGVGGSTITQQLARNLYLSPARTLHRKVPEALIARRLESSLDKRHPRALSQRRRVGRWRVGRDAGRTSLLWPESRRARPVRGRVPSHARPLELSGVLANECGLAHELTAAARARPLVKQR